MYSTEQYSTAGWALFPVQTVNSDGKCTCGKPTCTNQGKHPACAKGVDDASNDPQILDIWIKSGCNIGLACGDPSGMWCLDEDDDGEAIAALEATHEPLPKTWTVKSGGGGRHRYFRHDDRTANLKNSVKFSGSLDIRTTGGYTILPPSKHVSGKSYSWVISPDKCELASAPDWLIDLCPKHDQKPKSEPKTTSDTTFTVKTDSIVDRAKAYCEQVPPAISGNNGHGATFALVCRLMEVFGDLDNSEILHVLNEWNERCDPPWTQTELLHKISSARSRVTQQITHDDSDDEDDHHPIMSDLAYHGILGDFVTAVAPETEADPAGILVTLLTMCGNVIGNRPHVSVGEDKHGTNLFAALVGPTSSGKGMAFGLSKSLLVEADSDWCRTCIAFGLSSGEGLVERVQDPESDDPLSSVPLSRLLCFESEFSRPVTAMRREGNTLSPLLRSAWDCQTLEVMTRGKSKLRASNAFLSILANITPEELDKIINGSIEIANGFANRFLWCHVKNARLLPNGGATRPIVDHFGEPLRQRIEYAKNMGEIRRSFAAQSRWEGVYASLRESRGGVYGKATERAAPIVTRLSLIYALLDGSPMIEVQHFEAALAVWQFCDHSARLIFVERDPQTQKPMESLDTKLLKMIVSSPGVTRTELRKAISHRVKTDEFDAAINRLLSAQKIVRTTGKCEVFYPAPKNGEPGTPGTGNSAKQTSPVPGSQSSPVATSAEALSSQFPVPGVPTLGIGELMLWRATNAVEFQWNDERSCYWVTPQHESLVTPDVAAALEANQELLKAVAIMHKPQTPATPDDDNDDEFDLSSLDEAGRKFYAELMELEAAESM